MCSPLSPGPAQSSSKKAKVECEVSEQTDMQDVNANIAHDDFYIGEVTERELIRILANRFLSSVRGHGGDC